MTNLFVRKLGVGRVSKWKSVDLRGHFGFLG